MLKLHVEKRDTQTKAESVRKHGKLPAVFYGRKEQSTPIAVTLADFEKVWREAGESTIISLDGIGEAKEALIQDVDVHPVTGAPRHVDFYVIEKGKKLQVDVPFEFVGEAPAVEDLGGILVKVMHEIEIEALPKDLPHEITVDVSTLTDLESRIAVEDLQLPEGVKTLVDADETIAMITEPKEEEEEEPEEIDMEAIAVEGEETEKEGGGEGTDGETSTAEEAGTE